MSVENEDKIRVENKVQRHTIGKITYQGVDYDYSSSGYEIDDFLQVYKNNEPRGSTGTFEVALIASGKPKKIFSTKRLYNAVVNPLPSDVEKYSGLRIADYSLPEHYAARYVYETEAHRHDLIWKRQCEIDDVRRNLEYFVNNVHEVFSKYEIDKLGTITNKATGRVKTPKANGQISLRRDNGGSMMIYSYRAFMFTFVKDRRDDQTQIDHINGDSEDHRPCNLRWASPSENEMYKFRDRETRRCGVPYEGDYVGLKRFEHTQWYFGEIDGKYSVVNPEKKMRCVGQYLVTKRLPYPYIEIGQLHRVVAYVEDIISSEEFYYPTRTGVVVEHKDTDKTNFSKKNLKRGTQKSNNLERNLNPITTLRKRVRQLNDCTGEQVATYDSITTAAKAADVAISTMSQRISKNRACSNFRWEFY